MANESQVVGHLHSTDAPGTIKCMAASIKKFYKCMLQHRMIQESDYEDLCEDIKGGMPVWQETCAQYNNPDADNPYDIW
jgi:hypothetical protein